MEYMSHGSLKQVLSNTDIDLDIGKKLGFALDVAQGMEFLHGLNITTHSLRLEKRQYVSDRKVADQDK